MRRGEAGGEPSGVGNAWSPSTTAGARSTFPASFQPLGGPPAGTRSGRPSHGYDGPSDALALPSPPPALLRPGGRTGAHSAHAAQRDRARQGPPRLPVRRVARDGQDEHGEAARLRDERRGRAERELL